MSYSERSLCEGPETLFWSFIRVFSLGKGFTRLKTSKAQSRFQELSIDTRSVVVNAVLAEILKHFSAPTVLLTQEAQHDDVKF